MNARRRRQQGKCQHVVITRTSQEGRFLELCKLEKATELGLRYQRHTQEAARMINRRTPRRNNNAHANSSSRVFESSGETLSHHR